MLPPRTQLSPGHPAAGAVADRDTCQVLPGAHGRLPGAALLPRTRGVPKPPPTHYIQMLAASQTDVKASQPIPGARSWQPLTSCPSWPRGQKPQEPTGGMCQANLCRRQVRSPQPGSTDCSQNILDEGVVQDKPAPGAVHLSGCDGLNCASSSGKFKS